MKYRKTHKTLHMGVHIDNKHPLEIQKIINNLEIELHSLAELKLYSLNYVLYKHTTVKSK